MQFSQADIERPAHILAVDDLPDNLELIEAILDGQGYSVRCLEDGSSALNYIQQRPPDLILLDVMMPGMDGYEVTRQIRENEQLPYITILLITADERSNLVKGLDAGADDFIRKPVDIDELLARVRSLLRLKQSIDELNAILKQRDDFVARLTHDLRTPLVAANRILQFCIDGAFGSISEDLGSALANMLRNNQNLLEMANTLLEVYRHEAGQKTLTFSRVEMVGVVKNVASELEPLSREKQLTLQIEVPDAECWVRGDQLELRRVVTNVLGNAIKFTDEGIVTIGLNVTEHPSFFQSSYGSNDSTESDGKTTDVDRWLEVIVTDTGPGIQPQDQIHIFDWYRPGKHRNSSSGLGLHLSQRIAKMHGGLLSVESKPDRGSTFTLSLPMLSARPVTSGNSVEV